MTQIFVERFLKEKKFHILRIRKIKMCKKKTIFLKVRKKEKSVQCFKIFMKRKT